MKNNVGSQLDLDNAATALVTAQRPAPVAAAEDLDRAQAQLLGNPDLPLEEFPAYAQAKAALDEAQRNLDHTTMRAPMAGIATQVEQIQLGRFVMAGAPVFCIIDTSNPWVDANPKESDFTYVAVGQSVTLEVDAFPNHAFKGTVGSLSPGTGAQFAILPPQNASGNFVKVVQRVPVRIYFDKNDKFVRKLKAGMSVYATIDTNHRRSLSALLGLSPAVAQPGPRLAPCRRRAQPSAAVPGLRRNMVTICAMTATIMQALDTTIANVALPYMQGTLSASQDQINWVLTSYIVAAAIMTAPVGWIANRFGRKRIFIICSAGFTIASVLCGARAGHHPDGAVPPAAGRVRRRAGAAVAGRDAGLLRAARARQGDGDLGHGRDDGADHGPVAGRLADRNLFLALGVLRQSAVRHLHRARPHRSSWTRPRRTSSCASTGSASPRLRSPSARCSLRSTAASSSAGWNPTRSSPSSSSPASASIISSRIR